MTTTSGVVDAAEDAADRRELEAGRAEDDYVPSSRSAYVRPPVSLD
jgi:hypothetical protein